MAKKFISFLGAITYFETQYYIEQGKEFVYKPTNYVQEAILGSSHIDLKGEADQVIIFVTADASWNNYHNRIIRYDKNKNEPILEENDGLKSRLEQLKSTGQISSFREERIPNGNTQEEILGVFQKVFENLEEGDDVYFDVTYGFRSLPMLGIVLLNYAKTLKNVEVKNIFYGNYEAGRANQNKEIANEINPEEKEKIKARPVEAPIIELEIFNQLQEWTYAAKTFTKSGDARPLKSLLKDHPAKLGETLEEFTNSILACRGSQLVQELEIDAIKQAVSDSAPPEISKQMAPLAKKIDKALAPFSTSNLQNGFGAVQWCIDHNLIQQGYTFLLETLQSYVIEKVSGLDKINQPLYRELAKNPLNGYFLKNQTKVIKTQKRALNLDQNQINTLVNRYDSFVNSIPDLVVTYKRMTGHDGNRNDINHCGFRINYLTVEQLKLELESIFTDVKSLNL